MHLAELGERRIIDRIWETLGKREEYDDCVYVPRGDYYDLITTDFIGEGTHFMGEWDPRLIGSFFAAINLSDIAAMGGIPELFMASMFFPPDYPMENLEELVGGINSLLSQYHVEYRGGDLKESRIAGMSGIAIGRVERNKILKRRGARLGDGIYVTGALGKQAAGYYLWKHGFKEAYEHLLDVHPRIEEGRSLAGRATSCMDISDGLSSTITQLENINNLAFLVDFDEIPVHKLAYEVSEDYNIPLEHLVIDFGGEYELIYTSDAKILGKRIGEVSKGKGGIFRDGKKVGGRGYEHFSEVLDKVRGQ